MVVEKISKEQQGLTPKQAVDRNAAHGTHKKKAEPNETEESKKT
jgi:hypothetical protein